MVSSITDLINPDPATYSPKIGLLGDSKTYIGATLSKEYNNQEHGEYTTSFHTPNPYQQGWVRQQEDQPFELVEADEEAKTRNMKGIVLMLFTIAVVTAVTFYALNYGFGCLDDFSEWIDDIIP